MIQFNLLPDVKQEYIKAHRTQRLVLTVAVLVAGFCLLILVVLFLVVNVLQKTHLSAVNNDIKKYSDQLSSNTDLPKILTVQNQLKSLQNPPNSLLLQRPEAARLVSYINKVVPSKVSISQLTVDFTQHTMIFTGTAASVKDVNQFVDTLKFTTYTVPGKDKTNAFSNVVLTSFGRAPDGTSYTVNLNYDPAIFDSSQSVTFDVPKINTTRSSLDLPLFKAQQKATGSSQ